MGTKTRATILAVAATGIIFDYAGSTAPDGFLLCDGAAVSRATYAALFGVIGTTYGAGDGSTTFNVPDLRGRACVGKDNMGGTAANRLTAAGGGVTGTTLGATGGTETHALTTAQMPAHTHANTLTDPGHTHTYQKYNGSNAGASPSAGTGYQAGFATVASDTGSTGITITNASQGSGNAHPNVQPSLVVNKIICCC